jgi:hypothetical protein
METVYRYCEICGEPVYEGSRYTWRDRGDEREDEDGDYYENCGECETCGKKLCAGCGEFDRDGVCAGCRGEEEDGDE